MYRSQKLKQFLFIFLLFFGYFFTSLNAQELSENNQHLYRYQPDLDKNPDSLIFRPDPELEAQTIQTEQADNDFFNNQKYRPQRSQYSSYYQERKQNRTDFYYDHLLDERKWNIRSNNYVDYYKPSDFSVFESNKKFNDPYQSHPRHPKPYLKKQMPNLFDEYESASFDW